MQIKLDEFEGLSETRKLEVLHQHGVYIGKVIKGSRIMILLQLDSFYVEINYLEYRRHVRRLRAFTSTAAIDPYLENITIENLSL